LHKFDAGHFLGPDAFAVARIIVQARARFASDRNRSFRTLRIYGFRFLGGGDSLPSVISRAIACKPVESSSVRGNRW
jgi:hypothetical protein